MRFVKSLETHSTFFLSLPLNRGKKSLITAINTHIKPPPPPLGLFFGIGASVQRLKDSVSPVCRIFVFAAYTPFMYMCDCKERKNVCSLYLFVGGKYIYMSIAFATICLSGKERLLFFCMPVWKGKKDTRLHFFLVLPF